MKASTLNPALVEAAQRGEAGAIEQLLAATKPDLQRFARRLCAGPEDAEDAVQNALWILHRKVGMVRAVPAFAGWLFRVVARGMPPADAQGRTAAGRCRSGSDRRAADS